MLKRLSSVLVITLVNPMMNSTQYLDLVECQDRSFISPMERASVEARKPAVLGGPISLDLEQRRKSLKGFFFGQKPAFLLICRLPSVSNKFLPGHTHRSGSEFRPIVGRGVQPGLR